VLEKIYWSKIIAKIQVVSTSSNRPAYLQYISILLKQLLLTLCLWAKIYT